MAAKLGLWLLWAGVIVYAFGFAPPNQPDTLMLIQKLSTGQWQGINPSIVALFNIMGVWPLIYSCLLLIDGKMQKVAAWPFVTASFGVGAFALLPYLALRQSCPEFTGPKTAVLKLVDSRWTGLGLALAAIALAGYGLVAGDWSDFVQQWQTNRFIHVMSLDFGLLCLLFPLALKDDMARRGLQDARLFWLAAIPLVGAGIYLATRPALPARDRQISSPQSSQTLTS